MKSTHDSTSAANPVTDLINRDTGELNVLYLPGYPKVIRFDASRGIFTDDEKNPITKAKAPFTIKPVAFRVFRDDILGMGPKRWAEFFFINEEGVLCNLLVHGYSVDNLMTVTPKLFYQKANLCQVALTFTPVEKVSKATEAAGKKYFMCQFAAQKLPDEEIELNAAIGKALPIWRKDTFSGDACVELSINYRPPVFASTEEVAEEHPAEVEIVTEPEIVNA